MQYPTFLQVVTGMTSDDESMRTVASDAYKNFLESQPNEAVRFFFQILNTESDSNLKLTSAVFFKNSITDSDSQGYLWDKMLPEIKFEIRDQTLKSLVQEKENRVWNILCETLVKIIILMEPNESEQFVAEIFNLFRSDKSHHLKSALRILEGTMEHLLEFFKGKDAIIIEALEVTMSWSDITVRTESVAFMLEILKLRLIKGTRLSNFIPSMMETINALKEIDISELQGYLCNLIEIAESRADFFKPHGTLILSSLKNFSLSKDLDEEIRTLALEVLLCIAEAKPILARSIPNFIENVVEIILQYMLDIENEKYAEWLESGAEEELENEYLYYVGEESIDRLAKAFYEEETDTNFFPTIFRFLRDFLNRNEWQFNFVAIMTISQIAEYIPVDETEVYIGGIMQVLLSKLDDSDWRVRFAACHAIGQISLDHQPYVQENLQEQVLPNLIKTLDDSVPRVQAHALAAFINFAEEVSKASLLPHVEYVMRHLNDKLFSKTTDIVLEQTVSAIAVIAGVIGEDFMAYKYLIPHIILITNQYSDQSKRTLKGKAIECSTIIGLSVGKEKFAEYSNSIMDDLVVFYEEGFENDDPFREFVQHSITRMCRLMEENFIPYLPKLLPPHLACLTGDLNLIEGLDKLPDISEGKEYEELKRRIITLDTSIVENQEYALDFIKTCAEVLGVGFSEYIMPCTEAIFRIFKESFVYSIKVQGMSAMVYLIQAARRIYDINHDSSAVIMMITETSRFILTNIDDSYNDEDEFTKRTEWDYFIPEVSALDECLMEAGPSILSADIVKQFTDQIFQLIQRSFKTRESNKVRLSEGDYDDDDDFQNVQKENDQELDLCIALLDTLGTLMKHHKMEFFSSSLPICTQFIQSCSGLDQYQDNGLTLLAILLCADMFENLKELLIPFWNELLLPFVFGCMNNDDFRVRQPAYYSLGKAAQDSNFRPYANEALKALWSSSQKFLHKAKDQNKSDTDNAYTSIGHIVFNHFDAIEQPLSYVQEYLNYLPLKEDEIEGKLVHKDLMDRFHANDPRLVGPEGAFKKQILRTFLEIRKTPFSTDELDHKINHLFFELGQPTLESIISEPTPKQIKKLQAIIAEIFPNQQ